MPQAGSQIRIPGSGCMTSTIAPISGRVREVLTGTGFHVLRVPLEQPLVGVALDVHAEREPRLLVDQVGDQPPQERGFWILFWALRKTTPVMPDFLPSSSRMCR